MTNEQWNRRKDAFSQQYLDIVADIRLFKNTLTKSMYEKTPNKAELSYMNDSLHDLIKRHRLNINVSIVHIVEDHRLAILGHTFEDELMWGALIGHLESNHNRLNIKEIT